MGLTLHAIEKMHSLGLYRPSKTRILDVGSSNLYSADPEGILCFLEAYGQGRNEDLIAFANRLSHGSATAQLMIRLPGA